MGTTFTIPSIFTAVDKFSSPVSKMEDRMHSFTSRAEAGIARTERAFRKLTPALSDVSKQILSYVGTAALIGAGTALAGFTVKSVMDYESAISSLQAVTGVSNTELVSFKAEISDLANQSKKSSIDVAKSFEVIGSAMSQYLSDPKGLRQIAEAGITLSKASKMELEPSLQALTSVMNQFGFEADKAYDTINRLTAGEIVGSISTAKISEHLQQFGAVASANNVTISESVALVEVLGKKLPEEQLGRASRNLITFMAAAKGMPKEAREQLTKHGVSLDILMDKHLSFGARLKELSKIQGDAIAMEKFFGRENIAAGETIFQQLGLYNDWTSQIEKTNKAQEQASINSNTLAIGLEQLKAKWVNMVTGSDAASKSIDTVKSAIRFLTNNLETIVSVGTKVIMFFAAMKGILLVSKVALAGYNIALGISNALSLSASVAVGKSTIALKAYQVTLWLAEAAQWALNVAMEANPLGLIIAGISALIAGIVYLISKVQNWGEVWDGVVATMGYTIDAFVYLAKAAWGSIEDSFMTMTDNLVISWKTAQNAMGYLSDAQYKKDVLLIKKEQIARATAIGENGTLAKLSAIRAGQEYNGIEFKFSKDEKGNVKETPAMNAAAESAERQAKINSLYGSIGNKIGSTKAMQKDLVNPKAVQQEALVQNINSTNNAKVDLNINAPAGVAEAKTDNKFVNIKTSSTMPLKAN